MNLNRVQAIDSLVPVKNAIVSVSDKRDLDFLVQELLEISPELTIYSTGGTYNFIKDLIGPEQAKQRLRQISEYTGQPEMQGGLVKTLDFRIYLGLLSETYNPAHQNDLSRTGAVTFDLVVVNLYPFQKAAAEPGATLEDGRTHIDIGGPCMIRAAAKNFLRVAVLSDPGDYQACIRELRERNGALSLESRFRLAKKVFRTMATYDAAIAEYLGKLPDTAPYDVYEPKNGAR